VRKSLFVPIVVVMSTAAAAVAVSAVTAQASAGPTTVTFAVAPGLLTITTPDTANLGTVSIGSAHVSSALGNVTVDDERGTDGGSWTASVISTDFTTGASPTAAETIGAANVSYAPGTATSTAGVGTFTPGAGGVLATSKTAFTATGTTGVTTIGWDPTITVTLPAAVVSGTYTGTITHSVA